MTKKELFKKIRDLDISKTEIVRILGVTRATVWNWETEKKDMPYEKFMKLCRHVQKKEDIKNITEASV